MLFAQTREEGMFKKLREMLAKLFGGKSKWDKMKYGEAKYEEPNIIDRS